MTVLDRKYYRVYTRAAWGDEWVEKPHLQPTDIRVCVAPAVPSAKIKTEYGVGSWEDGTALTDGGSMVAGVGLFVRITVCDDAAGTNEAILFVGIIPAEQFGVHGQNAAGDKSATQTMTAYGLEWLLSASPSYAYVLDNNRIKRIGTVPTFNVRSAGGGVNGNKSGLFDFDGADPVDNPADYTDGVASCVFQKDGRLVGTAYELWSWREVLGYIAHWFPAYLNITYAFGLGVENYLLSMATVHRFTSVRATLNELIAPGRGLSWFIRVAGDDTVTLKVISTLDTELTVGSVTVPRNTDYAVMDHWGDQTRKKVSFLKDAASVVDKITVEGAPIKVCGTLRVSDGTLEAGWSAGDEYSYRLAASIILDGTGGKPDYAGLEPDERKEYNDLFRASDRMGRVYSAFRVPPAWDWKVKDVSETEVVINPHWDPAAGEFTASQGEYWNGEKVLLGWLPFLEGIDYTVETPIDNNKSGAEPTYRKLTAWVEKDGKLIDVTKAKPQSAAVSAMDDMMGVVLRTSPNHAAALNHFDGGEAAPVNDAPSEYDPGEVTGDKIKRTKGFDYTTLAVTAMIESDQRFMLSVDLGTSTGREKKIAVPFAELWRVAAGTVVDVDAAGEPEVFGSSDLDLRNDVGVLQSILSAAVAWYGQTHWRGTVVHGIADAFVSLGKMVFKVDVDQGIAGTRSAAVTAIHYKFSADSSSATAWMAHSDLSLPTIYAAANGRAAGNAAKPSAQSTTRTSVQVTELMRQINAIKRSIGPVIDHPGGSNTKVMVVSAVDEVNRLLNCYELKYDSATKTWSSVSPLISVISNPMFVGVGATANYDYTHYKAGRPIFACKIDGNWVAQYSQPYAFSEYAEE